MIFTVIGAWAEMHGDCGAFKTNIQQELKVWNAVGIPLKAERRPKLPSGTKLQLTLQPQSALTFPVPPSRQPGGKGPAFGGVFTFKPVTNGAHQVALGKRAWLDVVDADTNKIVESEAFDMQTKCDKMVKVITYNLAAGKDYWFQINSSPTEQLDASVMMVREKSGRK